MHCVKLPGQRLMARASTAGAGFQIRFTALGIPVTTVAGQVRPIKADVRPSADLCNRAEFDLKDP